jgi:acyl-CoA thioesterase I
MEAVDWQKGMDIELARNIAMSLLLLMVCWGCGSRNTEKMDTKELPLSATPETDPRPTVVAFGNSLTAGAGVPADENYPAKLQAKIDAAGYRYRVINAGINGETSAQGLSRTSSIAVMRPSVVIVEFGANDGLRGMPVEATAQNLLDIVSALQSAGAKVVLAGMQIPPNYGPQYTSAFRSIFPVVAKKQNASLIPFLLEGVGGRPALNQEDGIHPTPQGYDIVVENIWKALQPLL